MNTPVQLSRVEYDTLCTAAGAAAVLFRVPAGGVLRLYDWSISFPGLSDAGAISPSISGNEVGSGTVFFTDQMAPAIVTAPRNAWGSSGQPLGTYTNSTGAAATLRILITSGVANAHIAGSFGYTVT